MCNGSTMKGFQKISFGKDKVLETHSNGWSIEILKYFWEGNASALSWNWEMSPKWALTYPLGEAPRLLFSTALASNLRRVPPFPSFYLLSSDEASKIVFFGG